MSIHLTGSHGTLVVDEQTGDVQHYYRENDRETREDGDYDDIARIDVEEWKRTYPQDTLDGGDILDFGYWMTDGTYVPPCEDWRADFRDADPPARTGGKA